MLIAAGAGFVAGVASQLLWPALPAHGALSLLALALAALACRASGNRRALAASVAGAALGMALAAVHGDAVLRARLPAFLEGVDQVVEGEIVAVQRQADGGVLLQVKAGRLPWGPHARLMPDWRLRISSRDGIAALPGERWRLPVRLRRPHASQNPGVADFERYLFGERVVATGYLRDTSPAVRVAQASGWAAWRLLLLENVLPLLGDGPGDIAADEAQRFARAVLPALVLDERSLLSPAQWRLLADTGTAHLVAISGLHVALLWGALVWIAAVVLRRRADTLRYRAAIALPALALAVAYAALAGMPLPALRAVLMLVVATAFLLGNGQVPGWRVLLAAAVFVLLVDPLSVHASGFWLSFGAVALLVLLNDLRLRPAGTVSTPWPVRAAAAGLRMQVLLSLLLAPLLVGLFGAASSSSVVANIPAIPLVNLVALPLALPGFLLAPWWPALANLLIDGATAALDLLWRGLELVDSVSWLSPLQVHAAEPLHVVSTLVALTVLLLAANRSLRLAAAALLLLAWPVPEPLPTGTAHACVLDVGQGLAVAVRTSRHAVLYDAGPAWGERDAGAAVVVPAARALGVRDLDLLVLSHDDADHAGGAASVTQALRPGQVRVGDPRSLARTGVPGRLCDRRETFDLDGVRFVLLPGDMHGSDNDRSCVLHVDAAGSRLLVPGDSTRRRELALLETWGDAMGAEVLVAGHHGSKSSSSATFLHRVAPETVLYSASRGNRFGHPHAEVVARVRRTGAAMHETARSGALCFRLVPGAAPRVEAWRGRVRRFWRA